MLSLKSQIYYPWNMIFDKRIHSAYKYMLKEFEKLCFLQVTEWNGKEHQSICKNGRYGSTKSPVQTFACTPANTNRARTEQLFSARSRRYETAGSWSHVSWSSSGECLFIPNMLYEFIAACWWKVSVSFVVFPF